MGFFIIVAQLVSVLIGLPLLYFMGGITMYMLFMTLTKAPKPGELAVDVALISLLVGLVYGLYEVLAHPSAHAYIFYAGAILAAVAVLLAFRKYA